MRELRIYLKNWNINIFGNIKIKRQNKLKKIPYLDKLGEQRNLPRYENTILHTLEMDLNRLLDQEETI